MSPAVGSPEVHIIKVGLCEVEGCLCAAAFVQDKHVYSGCTDVPALVLCRVECDTFEFDSVGRVCQWMRRRIALSECRQLFKHDMAFSHQLLCTVWAFTVW